jgi:hypothetical protein
VSELTGTPLRPVSTTKCISGIPTAERAEASF